LREARRVRQTGLRADGVREAREGWPQMLTSSGIILTSDANVCVATARTASSESLMRPSTGTMRTMTYGRSFMSRRRTSSASSKQAQVSSEAARL
jgi:hypothetical protein